MFDTRRMDPDWHPIMAAQEGPSGTGRMLDPSGREYGRVTIRRPNSEIVYRAERNGEVIGWANSLKLAAYRLHMANLGGLASSGPPKTDWGQVRGH